jgi:hypothetical protein
MKSCCSMKEVIEHSGNPEFPDERWMRILRSRTGRKLLRLLTQRPQGASQAELAGICAEPALTARYLEPLAQLAVVVTTASGGLALAKPIDNFGPTLEWLVARVLEEDFDTARAAWAVRVAKMYGGGDFDVLAWFETSSALIYVECKSKPPTDVTDRELRTFLQLAQDLAPEVAVLLIDSDDPLQPLANRLNSICGGESFQPSKAAKLGGIYFGQRRCFVARTSRSVSTQLQKCVRYYSAFVRPASFWGEDPRDFLAT